MTAPWGQQDGEAEVALALWGEKSVSPGTQPVRSQDCPGLATLKDRAWACEARPDIV